MFNRWGDDGVGDHRLQKRRTEEHAGKPGDSTTDIVANVIRSLGYIVMCGWHPSLSTGWGKEGDSYIIMSIHSQDGKYVYGCSREDEGGHIGDRVSTRPLLGHRTIWDWGGWHAGRELRNAEDLKSFICEDDIISAINCGAMAVAANLHYWEDHRVQYDAKYAAQLGEPGETRKHFLKKIATLVPQCQTGISTIGNVLPSDIVEALRDFRHDDSAFRTEVDWEFYMGVMACPVAEEAGGGGSGAAAAAPAAAAAAPAQVHRAKYPWNSAAAAAAPAGSADGSDGSSEEDDA